jgi:phytol kinase
VDNGDLAIGVPTEDHSLVIQLSVVALWLSCVAGSAWGLSYSYPDNPELTRKVVHIGTGNVITLAWWLHIPAWAGVTASLVFSGVALVSYLLPLLPWINGVGRRSFGTFFYAISIGLLIVWFWDSQPVFAVLGVLVMTWGDGLAGLIGRQWGQRLYHLWDIRKSWEGSLTMLVVSTLVCEILLGSQFGWSLTVGAIALLVAFAATCLESFSWVGLDNLTVPLLSAWLAAALVEQLVF